MSTPAVRCVFGCFIKPQRSTEELTQVLQPGIFSCCLYNISGRAYPSRSHTTNKISPTICWIISSTPFLSRPFPFLSPGWSPCYPSNLRPSLLCCFYWLHQRSWSKSHLCNLRSDHIRHPLPSWRPTHCSVLLWPQQSNQPWWSHHAFVVHPSHWTSGWCFHRLFHEPLSCWWHFALEFH